MGLYCTYTSGRDDEAPLRRFGRNKNLEFLLFSLLLLALPLLALGQVPDGVLDVPAAVKEGLAQVLAVNARELVHQPEPVVLVGRDHRRRQRRVRRPLIKS